VWGDRGAIKIAQNVKKGTYNAMTLRLHGTQKKMMGGGVDPWGDVSQKKRKKRTVYIGKERGKAEDPTSENRGKG